MADSAVAVTAGSGTNIDTRTEATNGNHRQVVVIGDPSTNTGVAPVDATKGLAVDLTATGQNSTALKVDGSAVTQPVSAVSLPLPSGAATAAKQPALGTAGTPSSDVISVQGVTSMTALKVDGSAVTQPVSGTITAISNVVHVDDNSSTLSVDDGGSSLTVDGTVAVSGTVTVDSELTTADLDTGAGTDTRAVVGLVGAKSGGGALIPGDATAGLKVDLGADNDVTVTGTVAVDASGTAVPVTDNSGSLTVDNAALSVTGGGVEASALRVTLANDSTGVLSVDDNGSTLSIDDGAGNISIDDGGNSITVDNGGTFATQATLQTGTNQIGHLEANQSVNVAQINGVTTSMGNGVSGTGVQRVTIASDSTGQVALAAGTNGIGKLTSNSGVTIGAVEIAAAQTLSTVTTVSTVTNQSQEGGVNISLNAGAVDTGTRRVVQANGAGKTIVSKSGSASTSGNNTLVAAGTNKLKVFAFSLSTQSTTAMTCKFQDGASGTDLWSVILQAGTSVSTGANLAVSPPAWLFNTSAATLLNLNLSSANAVQWSVSYFDEV